MSRIGIRIYQADDESLGSQVHQIAELCQYIFFNQRSYYITVSSYSLFNSHYHMAGDNGFWLFHPGQVSHLTDGYSVSPGPSSAGSKGVLKTFCGEQSQARPLSLDKSIYSQRGRVTNHLRRFQ